MIEVLKAFSSKLDSFIPVSGSLCTSELTYNSKRYNMDYGSYKGNKFFVLIDLDVDSDYKYVCSVNNQYSIQYDTFELYTAGDEPSVSVPFPDEFTQDAYFNLMTMHDMHGIPVELLQVAHELYSLVKSKF